MVTLSRLGSSGSSVVSSHATLGDALRAARELGDSDGSLLVVDVGPDRHVVSGGAIVRQTLRSNQVGSLPAWEHRIRIPGAPPPAVFDGIAQREAPRGDATEAP